MEVGAQPAGLGGDSRKQLLLENKCAGGFVPRSAGVLGLMAQASHRQVKTPLQEFVLSRRTHSFIQLLLRS